MPKPTDIQSILILAAVFVSGCGANKRVDAAEMSRIEEKCGLREGTMSIDAQAGFKFNPDPNEKFENVDCALAEIRSSSLSRHMKYEFVGNEQPSPKKTTD